MIEENREYNKVLKYIRGMLAEEKIAIGDKLPTERSISETLSISRNSTREALRVLGNMGMIESRQGSGNYLVSDITKNIVDSLNMMLIIKSTNQSEISQLRRYMELAALNIALENNKHLETGVLEDILNKMEDAPISQKAYYDKKFHYFILCASNNQLMISIMNAFSEICENFVGQVLSSADTDKKNVLSRVHRSIYRSIANKDKTLGIQAINEHYDIIDELIRTQ